MKACIALLVSMLAVACGGEARDIDDAGPPDAAPADQASPPAIDSGHPAFDAGAPDSGSCPLDAGEDEAGSDAGCVDVKLSIATQVSCAISLLDCSVMDGEAALTIQNQQDLVLTMDRVGKGRLMAYCDATTLPQLLSSFDVVGYLGQTKTPRVASFGSESLCDPGSKLGNPLPASVSYLGVDLPAKYVQNPAGLAADWDAIIFCDFDRGPFPVHDWTSELDSFVSTYGKGLLGVMDYYDVGGTDNLMTQKDFDSINKITAIDGVFFDAVDIPWGNASLDTDLACVPGVPPPN